MGSAPAVPTGSRVIVRPSTALKVVRVVRIRMAGSYAVIRETRATLTRLTPLLAV